MEIKDPRNQQGLPLTVSVNGIVADSNGNIAITSRENISFTSSDLTAEHKYTVTNTKVVDIYRTLKEYNVNVTVYDPWVNPDVAKYEYNISVKKEIPEGKFDAVILAVAHKEFTDMDLSNFFASLYVLFDVKGICEKSIVDGRL